MELFLERWNYLVKNKENKRIITYLNDKGEEIVQMTYTDFDQKTKDLAYVIRSEEGWNIPERSTVMLVYPPSAGFFIAFVACLRANVIPVPVFPPDPTKLKNHMYLFSSVQESSKAEVCLTDTDYNYAKKLGGLKSFFSSSGAKWPDMRWIITDNELPVISDKSKNEIILDSATGEDIAFLQYTSGSTSAPKGVIVRHKNLAHNINTIVKSLEAGDDTIVVSWLPQYHDMGLIGSFLSCMYCGGTGYYMSPITFIKNPPLWLQLISKYHATHIQAPNFAYLLTARKLTQNIELDLSSLKHMFNAAEPVTELAVNRFLEVTGKYGVKPEAMKPGYGLAEHVVYVCDGGKQKLKVNKQVLETTSKVEIIKDDDNTTPYTLVIGCGKPNKNPSIDLKIVDINQLQSLGEDEVGEIWINSPSKADGYYNLEELSKEDFHAKLNDKDSGEYLRTGDLGFIHNEELFICGRKKDLIIIRGRNHYPQDLEHTVENNPNIRGGCVAAFSIEDDGEESLVIMAEIKDGVKDVKSLSVQLLSSISQEHGISCDDIVLIPPRTISKTTSGKISRNKCKQDYLEKKMKVLISTKNNNNNTPNTVNTVNTVNENPTAVCDNGSAKIHPQAEVNISTMNSDEIYVEYIKDLKNVLQNPISNVNDTFLALGVDSLSLTQLSALIEDKYKVDVDNEMLFSESCTPIKIYEYLLVNLGFENSDIESSVKRYAAGLPPPSNNNGKNKGFKKSKRETFCPFCPCCW